MSHSLIWLPHVLKNAGLKVALVDGWEDRGRGDTGEIFGVICHHTAGPVNGNMPTLNTLVHGRADLPGPLSQLGLGRDGTFYVIAAGRCNHAGKGIWKGLVNGNSNFIGIEAENTGRANDFPWPDVQLTAYHHGVAAILRHIGKGAEFCAGHKEYALPRGRKSDTNFDMVHFRSKIDAILTGSAAPITLIPTKEPGAVNGRPTLRRGAKGALVTEIQTRLKIGSDGTFGATTEASIRILQRDHGMVPDGIVGPKTWIIIDSIQ